MIKEKNLQRDKSEAVVSTDATALDAYRKTKANFRRNKDLEGRVAILEEKIKLLESAINNLKSN